jgi:hypothetical protein
MIRLLPGGEIARSPLPLPHPPLAHFGRLRSSLMTTGTGLIPFLTGSIYLSGVG